jgi:protein involved in polysaccharide export with SLBB domain
MWMKSKFARFAAAWVAVLAVFVAVFGQSGLSGVSGISRRSASMSTGVLGSGSGSGGSVADGVNYSFTQPSPAHTQPGMILPSDNSIDEHEYMIGSGDVFFITAVESPTVKYTAAVDQGGRAFIQNFGVVNIGKTSYAEAKKKIAEYITSMMKNPSEIYVALIQTKNATVSFTGRVRSPGSYEFPGSTRLLDAVRLANGGDLPQASDADLRQVQVISGDSSATRDLLAYLYRGDNSQNPYIYPGDHIRINATTAKVFISGAIKTPAPSFYPLKRGETLREFLSMFTLENTADTNNIIVYHSADNSEKIFTGSDMDHTLSDLDAITIPVRKNHPGIYTVSIAGEIASPGHYPIIENSTSARQLIDKAGGMKPTGNIDQAVVIRPVRNFPDRFSAGAPQTIGAVRPERGASVSMASMSLDYTIIKLILYNADKVILEPGDQIVIPKKDNFVYISGSVKSPGAYPFMPSKDSYYYITQAGGFSNNADKSNIQVYVKYGDVVQSTEPRCIESGSVIVVPASVQYKFLSQVLLPLITTIATTVGVGISIYNLRQ